MKILMIGALSTGGVSTHVNALMKEYDKQGLNVKFYNYYSKRGWQPGKKGLVVFYENVKKFIKMSIGYWFYLLFHIGQFNIVHIHAAGQMGGFLPVFFVILFGKIFRYKIIMTVHSSNLELFIKNHIKFMRFILNNSHGVIVVSEKQKNIFKKYFKDYKKCYNIPNGFDEDVIKKFKIKNKNITKEKSSDSLTITNIGWLMEKKGQIYLIDAIKKLVEEHGKSNIKCYIIGKGPLYDDFKGIIKEYDLENNIDITGYLNDKEMFELLQKSNLFILPSLDEGNPIVMFEALGFGLPVIGTKVGGIPEIISSEEHGLLIEPSNTDDIVDAIIKAMSKKWDNVKISKYGKNFTWENISLQTVDVYKRL